MSNSIKILKLLINDKEQFTIKRISEHLKMNYRIAYENVMLLHEQGLIDIRKMGNAKACRFSNSFDKRVFQAEYERREEKLQKKDLRIIHDRLSTLRFPFIALLFGSFAKDKQSKHSDIDIMTIGGSIRNIEKEISLLPDKIHLTSITYEEFIEMARSREFSVVSEAMRNNIILLGIEEYYRLLKNAG